MRRTIFGPTLPGRRFGVRIAAFSRILVDEFRKSVIIQENQIQFRAVIGVPARQGSGIPCPRHLCARPEPIVRQACFAGFIDFYYS